MKKACLRCYKFYKKMTQMGTNIHMYFYGHIHIYMYGHTHIYTGHLCKHPQHYMLIFLCILFEF
jgi:hypothetical protein